MAPGCCYPTWRRQEAESYQHLGHYLGKVRCDEGQEGHRVMLVVGRIS